MNPKISIVIPVYNTEQFLSECLESCIQQTLKEIEIIVVNDCSPGNCREIVKEFQKQDNRIKFIDLPTNTGTLNTRMEGYKIASGEYIQSLDSDDTLTSRACQIIYHTLQTYNADILHISMNIYQHPNKNNPVATSEMFVPKFLELNQQQWLYILFTRNLDNCMCSYIIKNKLIQKLTPLLPKETHITFYEDLLQIFTLAISIPVKKIVSIPNKLYEYRQGVGITTFALNLERYTKNLTDTIKVTSYVYAAAQRNNLSPELLIELMGYFYQMSDSWSIHNFLKDKEKQLQIIQKIQKFHLIWDYINMLGTNQYYKTLYSPAITTRKMIELPYCNLSVNEQRALRVFNFIRRVANTIIPPGSFPRNLIYRAIKITRKLLISEKTY